MQCGCDPSNHQEVELACLLAHIKSHIDSLNHALDQRI
jgi:hypothetical protein